MKEPYDNPWERPVVGEGSGGGSLAALLSDPGAEMMWRYNLAREQERLAAAEAAGRTWAFSGGGGAGSGGGTAGVNTAGGALPSSAIATGPPAMAPTVAGSGAGAAATLPSSTIATGAPAMAPTVASGTSPYLGAAATGAGAAGGRTFMGFRISELIGLTALTGGFSLLGGWMQARAAREAAEIQARAVEQALALQREMYQQSRSDLSPYMSAGAGAQTTLAGLMGVPMNPVPNVMSAAGGTTGAAHVDPTGRPVPANSPIVGTAIPRPGTTNPYAGLPPDPRYTQQQAAGGAAAEAGAPGVGVQAGPAPPNASGYVRMQAPDGSVADVPPAQVNIAIQRGARRL